MGRDLDLGDVVANHPEAKRELGELYDEIAELKGALYDEQHGITATLRADELDRLKQAALACMDVLGAWEIEDRQMVPLDLVQTLLRPLRDAMTPNC